MLYSPGITLDSLGLTWNWKFSGWSYQKSVADELDAMQSHMVSILLRIPRSNSEDWVMWARRSRRLARSLIARIGSWSEAWAQRTIRLGPRGPSTGMSMS